MERRGDAHRGLALDLGDLHVWLGRHGGDNEVDLRADVKRNGVLIAQGIQRCITDLDNGEKKAREVVVALPDPTVATFNGTSDTLSITLSARLGTTSTDTDCNPTSKKPKTAGVRVFYDSIAEPTSFSATLVGTAAGVIFNEVESNGGSPGDWAEFFNPGATPIDLSGHVFKDNDDTHSYRLPLETSIPAGGYLVLNEAEFGFGLGAVESVRLFAPDATTLLASYSWTAHAPTTYGRCPDGTGAFRVTTSSTKGAANDCSIVVRFNEVESNGGVPGDWAELINAGPAEADLSGYIFKDNDETHAYTIPLGTTVASGGYLVIEEAAFGFGLGGADSVRLFTPNGATVVDSYSWTAHAATTYARCPNGSGPFVTAAASTKGVVNSCVTVTTVLKVNEVESNGGSPGDWIELFNPGSGPVDASGLIVRDNDITHTYAIPNGTSILAATFQSRFATEIRSARQNVDRRNAVSTARPLDPDALAEPAGPRRRSRRNESGAEKGKGAGLSFEARLWQTADALRNNMDAAEYKHVVLGLIFLKYISNAFEAKHAELAADVGQGADPEDPDEYRAASIFWVPREARWAHLRASGPQPTIGTTVDDAMDAIERDNPTLKGVLPKDYALPGLEKQRLGQLINLVSDIALGDSAARARDQLGRVTSISSRNSQVPKARRAASSTRRRTSCACWSRCWRRTRAASTTRAAAQAACSSRARNSSRRTPEGSATSRSTGRNRITRRGASPR